jgi:ubiquitin C-terminal hydrolase
MKIDDDDYIYRLVGVNIHVGTADQGHYYSIINTNRGVNE